MNHEPSDHHHSPFLHGDAGNAAYRLTSLKFIELLWRGLPTGGGYIAHDTDHLSNGEEHARIGAVISTNS